MVSHAHAVPQLCKLSIGRMQSGLCVLLMQAHIYGVLSTPHHLLPFPPPPCWTSRHHTVSLQYLEQARVAVILILECISEMVVNVSGATMPGRERLVPSCHPRQGRSLPVLRPRLHSHKVSSPTPRSPALYKSQWLADPIDPAPLVSLPACAEEGPLPFFQDLDDLDRMRRSRFEVSKCDLLEVSACRCPASPHVSPRVLAVRTFANAT